MIPKIVILILAVGSLVAGVIWMLTAGRKPRFPRGLKVASYFRKHAVTVVIESRTVPVGVDASDLAHACARAVWASVEAWRRRTGHVLDELDECCVYFASAATFEASPYTSIKTAAAFLVYTGAAVGPGIPMIVVRDRLIKEVMGNGEPVIHECMHGLLGESSEPDKDRDHSHGWAWKANAGEHSIQAVAQRLYAGVS